MNSVERDKLLGRRRILIGLLRSEQSLLEQQRIKLLIDDIEEKLNLLNN